MSSNLINFQEYKFLKEYDKYEKELTLRMEVLEEFQKVSEFIKVSKNYNTPLQR